MLSAYLPWFSISLSAAAFGVSAATSWLTLFQRGTVKMTRPSANYFGPDGGVKNVQAPKVYLRSLLFSTSKQGRIVEAMYASVSRSESRQNFSIWVLGEDRLARGSGLYVGVEGVLANHHFLPPQDSHSLAFTTGTYRLEIYARLFGDKQNLRLFAGELEISSESACALASKKRGIYFDWGPDAGRYISHIEGGSPTTPVKSPMTPADWEKMITEPFSSKKNS